MPTLNIEGRRVKVDDSFLSLSPEQQQKTVEQIAAQIGVKPKASQGSTDTSFSSAFKYGLDQPLENIGTSMQAAGQAVGSETLANAGQGVRDFTQAPQNYEPASGRFINPQEGDKQLLGFGYEYLPRAIAEQSGQLAGSLAARGVGAAAGGAVGGAPGAAVGAFAGPAAFEFVQQVGPIALARAKNNGRTEPTWDDWTVAAGGAGLSGALNAIGVKGLGSLNSSLVKNTVREGLTEGGQSLIQQGAETAGTQSGLSVSPKQAIGEGILGAGSAGVTDATVKGASKAAGAVGDVVNAPPQVIDQDAAVSVARRLLQESKSNEINLKDVDRTSPAGAQLALDNTHTAIAEDIKATWNEIKGVVGQDVDSISKLVQKAMSNAARRDAANKVKNMVADDELSAIANLELKDRNGDPIKLGDLDIGQKLLFNLKESNELTRLVRQGPKGGVSQFTDKLNPLGSGSTYQGGDGVVNALSLIGAIVTGGVSTAAQVGAVGAGRAIDALTGRRSRVQRFVNSYADQDFTAPESIASKSYFAEKAAIEQAIADAKTEAERQKAQERMDRLAAKEAERQKVRAEREAAAKQKADERKARQDEAQRQRDELSKKRSEEQTTNTQLDTLRKTLAFQKRMQTQRAQEEAAIQRQQTTQEKEALAGVQTTMDFQSRMQRQQSREEAAALRAQSREAPVNEEAVFRANLARVMRVARAKQSLLKQKERALAAEAKAKTAEEKKLAAETIKTVSKREAKVDAIVKSQKVVLKAQKQQQKQAQAEVDAGWTQADLEKLGKEGGKIRNKTREQRGTENIMNMQNEALAAADSYPDKAVGAKVRVAVEKLRDNLRGIPNNQKRIALYENLVKEVGDKHEPFVQRHLRGLAYVFDR